MRDRHPEVKLKKIQIRAESCGWKNNYRQKKEVEENNKKVQMQVEKELKGIEFESQKT